MQDQHSYLSPWGQFPILPPPIYDNNGNTASRDSKATLNGRQNPGFQPSFHELKEQYNHFPFRVFFGDSSLYTQVLSSHSASPAPPPLTKPVMPAYDWDYRTTIPTPTSAPNPFATYFEHNYPSIDSRTPKRLGKSPTSSYNLPLEPSQKEECQVQ